MRPFAVKNTSLLIGFLVIVFAPVFLMAGCAQPRQKGAPVEATETGIDPDISPDVPLVPVFPHPAAWAAPTSHGTATSQYGVSTCLKCHKESSSKKEEVPACSSCHPQYPHQEDWVKKEVHGATVLTNGRGGCATQCHGYDLEGGLSKISCTLCHTIYPHTTQWVAPAIHGNVAERSGKEVCKGCHGDDFKGGSSEIGCDDCHEDYPHQVGWQNPEKHGTFALENGRETCATLCHGNDLKGGITKIGCDDCHGAYPHSATWEIDHRGRTLITGKEICKSCHGEDFKREIDDQNCYSCHADYPHPKSAEWIPYDGGHGKTIQSGYSGSTVTCQGCHGRDLENLKGGQNCFSCHPSYPNAHREEGTAWEDYEGHGRYTLARSKAECRLCHGADYKGGARANPSCTSCHASYPHSTGWRRDRGQPQGHGDYVRENATASCATARCHGVGLVPTAETQGPACNSCHTTYPHPEGWDSGRLHGPSAQAEIDQCKNCHGPNLDQAPEGSQTCQECHPSYLKHQTAEIETIDWETYRGHGSYVLGEPRSGDTTECRSCHGTDYLGGVSHVSCRSCHESYPHTQARWAEYEGHGAHLSGTLRGNATNCKTCHGNDLAGGHSGVSCYSCHANYPHTDPNWVEGDRPAHMTTFMAVSSDECTSCHGRRYDRSIRGTSCLTCHADGVTHASGWENGSGHGRYFTELYDSSSDTNCSECHGSPVVFNDRQRTASDLVDASSAESAASCYSCHWAYPHTTYSWSGGTADWSVAGSVMEQGHVYYLSRSPLFVDEAGRRPGAGASRDRIVSAIENTCGGAGCHRDGERSTYREFTTDTCAGYCHRPRVVRPELIFPEDMRVILPGRRF